MQRYRISHVWNEDPNYEAMARSMLDLLLRLEEEGKLDDLLGTDSPNVGSPESEQEGEAA